jgi:tetratricopeptide (TPR) repeat protein
LEVIEQLVKRLRLSDEDPLAIEFHMNLGRLNLVRHELQAAQESFERILGIAFDPPSATKALALRGLARKMRLEKRFEESTLHLQRALDNHGQALSDSEEGDLRRELASLLRMRNQPELAKVHAESAVELHQEMPVERAKSLITMGALLNQQGNNAEAKDVAREALEIFEEAGLSYGRGRALQLLGEIHYQTENFEESFEHYETAARLLSASPEESAACKLAQAQISLQTNNLQVADELLSQAHRVYERLFAGGFEPLERALRLHYEIIVGDKSKAKRLLDDLRAYASEHSSHDQELFQLLRQARETAERQNGLSKEFVTALSELLMMLRASIDHAGAGDSPAPAKKVD